jgi:uncharacterized protein YfaP (DUF2135 family)
MRPTNTRFCALAALCLTALTAHAQTMTAPFTVSFSTPPAGVVDGDLVVGLEARVSDPRVRQAMLTVNGVTYEVPVEQGAVTQNVVAVPGVNRVMLSAARGDEVARASSTFFLRGPRVDLMVVLGWASRGEIIDLWTREPSGETCKWDHRETRSGGRLLDFSSAAIGFGSQAYALPTVVPGRYRVKVHYWSASSPEDNEASTSWEVGIADLNTVDDMLAQSVGPARERLLRERRDVERRLDLWARPAAPQTPVHAEVVLFANTRHERRWRFDRTPQRTGQLDTIGEIEVTAEMIRAAREDAR